MDFLNDIDLQECPICGGAGFLEEEQGWLLCCAVAFNGASANIAIAAIDAMIVEVLIFFSVL